MNFKKHKILASLLSFILIFTTGCTTLTSCFNSDWSSIAPRNSFVQVLTERKDGMSTGSGVIIAHKKNSSIILTAGHVCENAQNIYAVDIEEKIYISKFFLRATEDDLCLFVTSAKINFPQAKFSNSEQNIIGKKIWSISAPLGIHGKNLALVFDGYFQGTMKLTKEKHEMNLYTIPTRGGSSGSPVFNENWEIIGVISRGIDSFENVALAVSIQRIRLFLQTLNSNVEDM